MVCIGPVGIAIARALPILLALLTVGCEPAASGSPSLDTEAPTALAPPTNAGVVACVGINAGECQAVTARVLAALPAGRGEPFSIRVQLFACADGAGPCPESLAARRGQAIVEYADEGLPLVFGVAGAPLDPAVEPGDPGTWTDPIHPGSPRVQGPGPYRLEVGHCGILHVVDFDAAFWVVVGQVDGEAPGLINAEAGTIRLAALDRAEYRGPGGEAILLARFPGAKRFQLCD